MTDQVAGTGRSALMLLLIVAVIVAAVIALFTVPGALESTVTVIAVILIALVAIAAIIVIFAVVLAVPMYAHKGEKYQTDVSYDLDDVRSVKETDSEEKKAE